jgi:hypothetical protein
VARIVEFHAGVHKCHIQRLLKYVERLPERFSSSMLFWLIFALREKSTEYRHSKT